MPRIFDNISQQLLKALRATLQSANHADFGSSNPTFSERVKIAALNAYRNVARGLAK